MKVFSELNRRAMTTVLMLAVWGTANAGPSLHLTTGAWHNGDVHHATDTNYHSISSRDAGHTDAGGHLVTPYIVSSNASGVVNGGVIKASAQSSYTTGPLGASSSAYAQWSDQFRIDSNEVSVGTVVQIHYSFVLDANLGLHYVPENGFDTGAHSMGFTEWRFSHYIGGNPVQNFGERIDILNNGSAVAAPQGGHGSLPSGGRIDMVANAAIGSSTSIYMGLLAQTFIGDGRKVASANAFADLGNSLYWGGINNVTLADGSSVRFTALSDSGTNYVRSYLPTADLPEPSSSALIFLAGLGMAMLRTRRGKK